MSASIADIDRTIDEKAARFETAERSLASGRSVLMKTTEGGDELQIRSPSGDLELVITFGEGAPVVRLTGARLELDAPETIAFRCRQLDVSTEGAIRLNSAGSIQLTGQEMRVRTADDIHLNGEVIRLNC